MKIQLVQNWQSLWKAASVQIGAAAIALSTIIPTLPDYWQHRLGLLVPVIMLAGVIARGVKQESLAAPAPDNTSPQPVFTWSKITLPSFFRRVPTQENTMTFESLAEDIAAHIAAGITDIEKAAEDAKAVLSSKAAQEVTDAAIAAIPPEDSGLASLANIAKGLENGSVTLVSALPTIEAVYRAAMATVPPAPVEAPIAEPAV